MHDVVAVGVDAGGTKTRALVSSNGARAGEAEGPGANPTTLGVDDAADALLTVVRRALAHRHPTAIVVGAAGAGRPAVAAELEAMIGSAFPGARIAVGDDAAIALRSAIPAGPGIVLIAGTGSIAYAENGERHARVGGLGYLAGDEGSAFAIGLAAVRLYGRVLDGRARADETTELVARALRASDRDAYLAALYDAPPAPAPIAALASSILTLAGEGNRASAKIVQQAGLDLGELVKSTARAAGLLEASPAVALAGGLLAENSLLTFLLETRIVGDLPGASILRGAPDGAATGALRLAEALAAR
jgi:N-acetylglucosamine kinase-like BadF-type ATPase